jgi:hypothetical protein
MLSGEIAPARNAFQSSLEIREKLGQSALAMEPLAGLAALELEVGNLDRAAQHVERILNHLANGGTLNVTDEPLRVYYNCYQVLLKKQDPRVEQVLQDAVQLLEVQTAGLRDERLKTMYVENVPWRRALRNAWQHPRSGD